MKSIEAVILPANLEPTVKQLYRLGVERVTVESVQVFRSDLHQKMIHRGCQYEHGFAVESRIQFHVPDQNAAQAETIVEHAKQAGAI